MIRDATPPDKAGEGFDEDRSVFDMLGLPLPSGWCPNTIRRTIRSLEDGSSYRVVWTPCDCWSCSVCIHGRRCVIGWRFGIRLVKADDLYHCVSTAEDWEAQKRWVQRVGASYVRVVTPGGATLLVANCKTQPRDGLPVTGKVAVRIYGAALLAIVPPMKVEGKRFRPVTNSNDWRPPPGPEPKWELVGWAKQRNPAALIALLAEHGVEATEKAGSVRWSFPAEWPPDKLSAVKALVVREINRSDECRT